MQSQIQNLRHSLAHILAQAVQRTIDSAVQLGTGPAIETGFYYDMKFSEGVDFNEEQLKALNKAIEGIAKENQGFGHYTAKDKAEALKICDLMQQSFKKELIEKFYQADEKAVYTFYYNFVDIKSKPILEKKSKPDYFSLYEKINSELSNLDGSLAERGEYVTFLDLCEGGHVENTKEIADGSFMLEKIAGAYRQGKEENPQMTRIYGLAFQTKDALKEYVNFLEEAKKRDHRVLGQKLKLFTISQLVGSGLPLIQPNGMVIRKEIEDYLRSLHKVRGYDRVWTPHLAKEDLYEISGHSGHYLDDMFSVYGGSSKEKFYVKPMNCPHHYQLFADNQFSYRDMPIRYFEPATVYRDEKTGQLSGLTRVRSITQDDGHLFCRVSQIHEEVSTIVQIIKEFYTTMGMMDGYRVRLSIRGDDKENYLGSDEVRETSENALKAICESEGLPYQEGKGEAAFYGPKLDFMFKDAINRERQLATCQLDFNAPDRFDLGFTNENGERERPVVIHRAISGSLERFMGVMIEHFAGAFPLWLAPTQIQIVPVAEKFNDYAFSLQKKLKSDGLRVKTDDSTDSFSKKIRNAELEKIPYIVIVGEKEETENTVSVREFRSKKQYEMGVEEFGRERVKEYVGRVL
ncbi:MAG TPA: threonine--tRNA ligase [Candidatus Absconditabacterales bacterium]|nr:threonine--tRNA ligase [Candidatus Absconditabacterales bacterium]